MSPSPDDRAAQLGIDTESLEPFGACMTRRGLVEVRAGTVNGQSLIVYGIGRSWQVMLLERACVTPAHLTLHVTSSGWPSLTRRVFKPFRPGGAGWWPRRRTGHVDWVILAGCSSVAGVAVDGGGLHAILGLTTFAGSGIAIFAPGRRIRRLAVTAYDDTGQILQRVMVPGSVPRPLLRRRGSSDPDAFFRPG